MLDHANRIFYVGTIWEGSTCLARMRAMQALGCQVQAFDTTPYLREASWTARQLGYRLSMGPATRRLNIELLEWAESFRNRGGCIWIDKGLWVFPETLQCLKEIIGATLAHYTPDPQVTFQQEKLRHFRRAIRLYDVLFTTKPFELDSYMRLGGRNVVLVNQSYDDTRIYPRTVSDEQRQSFGSDVCFIGQYTRHYAELIGAAVATGAHVRLWGPNWSRRLWRHSWARSVFVSNGVWGYDYSTALNATKIALCLLSKRYAETTTTRTFEIPGCGVFMLAERTNDHLALFEEGEEAEFFSDELELKDKIHFYLKRSDLRSKIAAAGHARCQRDGYGDRARMRSLLNKVSELTCCNNLYANP